MFILVKDIVKIMSEMAPARLAEDWDNVGLQVGRYEKEVRVILCALDFLSVPQYVVGNSAAEHKERGVEDPSSTASGPPSPEGEG